METITSIKTLFRAWLSTLLLLLLCAVGVALLSMGVGMAVSTNDIMNDVSNEYTTIAVYDYNALSRLDNDTYLNTKMAIRDAADSVSCARFDRKAVLGAYIKGVKTFCSETAILERIKIGKSAVAASSFDDSYRIGAFIIECYDTAVINGIDYNLLRIDEIVAFNEALYVRNEARSQRSLYGNMPIESIPPEYIVPIDVGKRYLVKAHVYSNISNSSFELGIPYDRVRDPITMEITGSEYPVYELNGTLEDALDGKDGDKIRSLINECQIIKYSVDVIATENTQSIPMFNQGKLFITKGRDITQQEYADVSHVCLLSEGFAYLNDIQLGDKIDMMIWKSYFSSSTFTPSGSTAANPLTERWSRRWYSNEDELNEAVMYTVVGFYKTPEWGFFIPEAKISPNTIIIPCEHFDTPSQVYVPATIESYVVDNGCAEQFLSEYEALIPGSAKYFIIYDQGFSEVLPVVETFVKNAKSLGIMSVGVWGLTAALFVLIMVLVNRRDVGIMLSLGSGRSKAFCALFTRYFIIAVLGSALGGLAAYLLFDRALAYLGEFSAGMISSGTSFSFKGDPINTVYCALAALGALTVVSLASAALSARANARELLR